MSKNSIGMRRPIWTIAYRQVRYNWGEYAGIVSATFLGSSFSTAALSVAKSIQSFILLILFAAIASIAVSMISVSQTVAQALTKNRSDYALMRASGADDKSLYRLILLQVGTLATIGSSGGTFMGWPVAKIVTSIVMFVDPTRSTVINVEFSPLNMVCAFILALSASMATAFVNARRYAVNASVKNIGEDMNVEPIDIRKSRYVVSILVFIIAWCGAAYFSSLKNLTAVLSFGTVAIVSFYMSFPVFYHFLERALGRLCVLIGKNSGRLAARTASMRSNIGTWVAAAYSIGCLLAAAASVVSMSSAQTDQEILSSSYASNIVVQAKTSFLDYEALEDIKTDPLVKDAAAIRQINARNENLNDGSTIKTYIATDNAFDDVMSFNGDANAAFKKGEAVVGDDVAARYDYKVGDVVSIKTPDGIDHRWKIGAITDDPMLDGSLYAPGLDDFIKKTFSDNAGRTRRMYVNYIFITSNDDRTAYSTQAQQLMQRHSAYLFRTLSDWVQVQSMQTYMGLLTFYMITSLVVTVSVIALMTSIALSITQRRRELALLRAAGMSNGQLWASTIMESSIIAVSGGILGTLMGTGFGYCLVLINGYTPAIPWDQIGWLVVASEIFGIMAALAPTVVALKTIGVKDMEEQ